MEDVFAIIPTDFGNSLIFPLVMSPVNEEAGAVSTFRVVCLVLKVIMKDQVEQLNKGEVAATAIGIYKEAKKKFPTSVHLPFFPVYRLFALQSLTSLCFGLSCLHLVDAYFHCKICSKVLTFERQHVSK